MCRGWRADRVSDAQLRVVAGRLSRRAVRGAGFNVRARSGAAEAEMLVFAAVAHTFASPEGRCGPGRGGGSQRAVALPTANRLLAINFSPPPLRQAVVHANRPQSRPRLQHSQEEVPAMGRSTGRNLRNRRRKQQIKKGLHKLGKQQKKAGRPQPKG